MEEAGVDTVSIDQIDQGNYIVTALLGNFQAFQWRNHSGVDLDEQYIWWHSSTALPVGQLALNFGRIKDPVIDQALDANRGETDPAKKQELRRDGQQALRRAVLRPLGQLDDVGRAARPEGAGAGRATRCPTASTTTPPTRSSTSGTSGSSSSGHRGAASERRPGPWRETTVGCC